MSKLASIESRSALHSEKFPMVLISSIVNERTEKGFDKDFKPLSVGKQGVTAQLEGVAKTQSNEARKVARRGDLVINSRSDRKGASGLASEDGTVSLVYSVMTPKTDVLEPRFGYYLLRSTAFQEEFFRWGTGIVDDLWSTNFTRMSRIRVPLPSIETQRRIADYLDRETGEIDAMIGKLSELTNHLVLRANRVVDEAIFTTSKPASLGYAVDCLPGFAFKSSKFSHNDSDIPLLRGVNVKPDRLDWSETVYWPEEMTDGLGEYFLQSGDIVLGMDRPFIGSGTRVVQIKESDPKSLLVQRVLRIRPLGGASSRYIYHALKSKTFETYVTPETTGISVPHISETQVRDFKVPFPPLEEQRRIADHLDAVTAKIDAMLIKVAELKDLLAERRAALITNVVTGRKDVA